MNLKDCSDEELMALYQEGNDAAFNALYLRYANRVYGYLRKRLRDPQAVNDLFQAAFLKLHRSRAQYNSTFLFAPWLFAVVRTSLLDWRKDYRNQVNTVEVGEETLATLPPETPALDRASLSGLPQPQRAAVEMRYFDDLSFEEIAGRLDTTSGNARQLVSRGLKTLKSFFRREAK